MLDTSWEMWLARNKALHGDTIHESRDKRIANLQDKVSLLYRRAHRLKQMNDKDVTIVFKLDEKKRKKKGVVALETWTELAEKVLNAAEERLERIRENGLTKWLNRETEYQDTQLNQ